MAEVWPASESKPSSLNRPEPTTVVLASRRTALLRSLYERLHNDADVRLLGESIEDPERLLACLGALRPRVLLLDAEYLDLLGRTGTQGLRERHRDMRVLLLCSVVQPVLIRRIVRNCFHGFVLVDKAPENCANAIRVVDRGELWMPRAALEQAIFDRSLWIGRNDYANEYDVDLTKREAQAVECLRRGMSNKEIAWELGIKVDTVKKHLRNAYAKMGIHRRTELMVLKASER